jgi:hypothetical protein
VRVTGRMAPAMASELRAVAERWDAALADEGAAS